MYILSVFSSSKCSLFDNSNYLVPILFTFYIQDVLKVKKNNPGAKRILAGLAGRVMEMAVKIFALWNQIQSTRTDLTLLYNLDQLIKIWYPLLPLLVPANYSAIYNISVTSCFVASFSNRHCQVHRTGSPNTAIGYMTSCTYYGVEDKEAQRQLEVRIAYMLCQNTYNCPVIFLLNAPAFCL